jgi:hypothetical protein
VGQHRDAALLLPTRESWIRGFVEDAIGRFRSTNVPHGTPSDEPELGRVMGEPALRSARDKSIASIMNEMYVAWHRTLGARCSKFARWLPENPAASSSFLGDNANS